MKKEEILKIVILENNLKTLNPMQEKALEAGLLTGKSLVVSSPTSSGKTLLAEIAGLNIFSNKQQKMIYLCPLVALAREKYEDFKRKYEKYGIKVALSVGNYDSSDPFLTNFHWIVCSNEKLDSLIRHKIPWIDKVGLIVVDEIHLLNDTGRGPTLEVLLTTLSKILKTPQFLAFSATIKNAEEIGDWLGAEVVKSNFRPTPLYKGILIENKIKMFGKDDYLLRKNSSLEESIVEDTLLRKKQAIFFLSSRRNAESLAEKLSKTIFHFLNDEEIKTLKKISEKIENILETPTVQCRKLAKCIKNGVAFYHSGLVYKQRALIEEFYKKGLIKIITSTTALAYGINLPNWRAIIRDVKRYYPGLGSVYLPLLEIEQMFGRSGRPQFDSFGEGILVAKNKEEGKELEEYYIKGELEEISSKIASEAGLRMHTLALIANGFCRSQSSLLEFFKKTFFGKKYKEIDFLKEKIEEIISLFEGWNFVETEEIKEGYIFLDKRLTITKIGKRISELYIDPLTANNFIENLKECNLTNEFSLLCFLAQAQELKPSPALSTKDITIIEKNILLNKDYFFFQFPDEFDDEYEEFQREVKLATVFSFWIEEKSEEEIRGIFKITPGELYTKLEVLDWLIYSILEIGKMIPFRKEVQKILKKLRVRLKYGIKEELIPLVKIKGVGRKRARLLFEAGYDLPEKIKKSKTEEIAKILKSKLLAQKIKSQLD